MTAGGNWGLWGGIGAGLDRAASIYSSLTEAAKQRALQAQGLALAQQAQNRADRQQADQEALQGFVSPGQVQPLPQGGPEQDDTPSDTAASLSPIGDLATGQGNPFAPSKGQTSGGKALPNTGGQGALPASGLFDVLQRVSQGRTSTQAGGINRPNQSVPGPTNSAAQTGQLGGYDTNRYLPVSGGRYLDVQGPEFQRQMALMRAMKQAELANQLAVRQTPEAVNPQQLDIEQQTRTEAARHNKAEEGISLEGLQKQLEQMKIMFGFRQQSMGKGFADDFANRTKDDRKAGELAQQLQDAYGQATGATTPDGRPNAAALKSLVVNQIANTEPGMQVRLGTLRFNGLGGDMSMAGKLASNVDVALSGLPPQQQIQALHQVAQQMIGTKAARYAKEYQAEAAAHPDVPNYEPAFLAPTLHPSVVFGSQAAGGTGAPGGSRSVSSRDLERAKSDPGFAAFLKSHGVALPGSP